MAGLHGLTSPSTGGSAAKRARLDIEYTNLQNAHQNDRVEVIKLPPTINSNGTFNLSTKGNAVSATTSSSTTVTKETHETTSGHDWTGINLSSKSSTSSQNADSDGDAPLNLSMKTEKKSDEVTISTGSNSLQSLSTITAALGTGSGGDRICKYFYIT